MKNEVNRALVARNLILFIIAGCAFYITTTIRVISYLLPMGVDKQKGEKSRKSINQ